MIIIALEYHCILHYIVEESEFERLRFRHKMAEYSTPITPRMQQLRLESSPRTGRSLDSGYGSLETSPTRSPQKRCQNRLSSSSTRLRSATLHSYDGNSSEESEGTPEGKSDSKTTPSPSNVQKKFITLPRVSRRRIARTDSFSMPSDRNGMHQRHGSDNTGLNGSKVSSLRALDRFVPLRDHVTPGSEKLRTTKPLGDLTPSERLVRHNQDAPDPFCFRRRALPPSPTEGRRARASSHSRTTLDTSSFQADNRVRFLIPKRSLSTEI